MTTYRVATLSMYVLVEAANEDQARELAMPLLQAEARKQLGRDIPITIRTVRPATPEEIELQQYHDEMIAAEEQ